MNTIMILGAGLTAFLVLSGKKGSSISPNISTPELDLSVATEERFLQHNTPIGIFTHGKSSTTVNEYSIKSLTLGITRGFSWKDPILTPEPSGYDDSTAAIEATKASKPWSWGIYESASFLRNSAFGSVAMGIILHESKGDPYATNENSNGTLDLGLGQLNDATLHDPSSWGGKWRKAILARGLWSALCPWYNAGTVAELAAFWNGGKNRGLAELLTRYAGWNQFLVTPHQPYLKTAALVALFNDLYK
ncbi:MAG: hypothetical protein WC477_07410 [Patescibacteria group bacterium]